VVECLSMTIGSHRLPLVKVTPFLATASLTNTGRHSIAEPTHGDRFSVMHPKPAMPLDPNAAVKPPGGLSLPRRSPLYRPVVSEG